MAVKVSRVCSSMVRSPTASSTGGRFCTLSVACAVSGAVCWSDVTETVLTTWETVGGSSTSTWNVTVMVSPGGRE